VTIPFYGKINHVLTMAQISLLVQGYSLEIHIYHTSTYSKWDYCGVVIHPVMEIQTQSWLILG